MSEIKNFLDYQRIVSWMGEVLRSPRPNGNSMDTQEKRRREADFYLTKNQQLTASERLNIYSIDYWSRCLESLDEDFPTLHYLLGKDKLYTFWESYLKQYPSRSYTLRNLGQSLPLFFQQSEESEKRLYSEIAQFEFALIEAFDEATLPLYEVEHLTEEQKTHLAEIPLSLQPYVRLLDISYPVDILREHAIHKEELPPISPLLTEASLITFRKVFTVHYQRVSKMQARFFRLFQKPVSLSDACTLFIPQLSPEEMESFASEIQFWMQTACSEQWLALAEK